MSRFPLAAGLGLALLISAIVIGQSPHSSADGGDCTDVCWVAQSGNDSNAGTEGAPFLTIQKALDTVADGGTVRVGPGSYDHATMALPKSVLLLGAQAGTPGTAVRGPESIVTDDCQWNLLRLNGSVTVDGFTFQSSGTWCALAISFEGGSLMTIKNSIFRSTSQAISDQIPIAVYFQDNLITDSGAGVGVTMEGSSLSLTGNTFQNLDNLCIQAWSLTNLNISDNIFDNCGWDGLYIKDSTISVIQSNQFLIGTGKAIIIGESSCWDCLIEQMDSLTIKSNIITNWDAAILLYQLAATTEITGNSISSNTAGLSNLGGEDVVAACNWWGSADGPSGEGPGTGDSVSENVIFEPWRVREDDGACGGSLPEPDPSPSPSPSPSPGPSLSPSPAPSPSATATPTPTQTTTPISPVPFPAVPSPTSTPAPTATPGTRPPAPTYTLDFGWNLVGWTGIDGIAVEDALQEGQVWDDVTAIYHFNQSTGEWTAYFPGMQGVPRANDLLRLFQGEAYWIATDTPGGTRWTPPTS